MERLRGVGGAHEVTVPTSSMPRICCEERMMARAHAPVLFRFNKGCSCLRSRGAWRDSPLMGQHPPAPDRAAPSAPLARSSAGRNC